MCTLKITFLPHTQYARMSSIKLSVAEKVRSQNAELQFSKGLVPLSPSLLIDFNRLF